MKNNGTQQYLSKMAKNVTPYQWEKGVLEKTLRFDANTMPYPPACINTFLDFLKNNCPVNEYADPSYIKLKKLIAKYESVNPDMITITNSGDEAIDILAKTFLNPGDYFIVTPPTYEMFSIQCEINNGKRLEIPLTQEIFTIKAEEIIKKSSDPKVKLIFLCNPNNPTGTVIAGEIIEKVVQGAKAIVVVDEAYREFYGKSVVPLLRKYRNLVILRSFSKFAAIAGARIGYLLANQFLSQKFDGIRFPMGVSLLSYKLAEFILDKDKNFMQEQIEMIKNERIKLTDELRKLGLCIYPSQANFILVKIGKRATEFCQKLKNKGILIRDRSQKKYLAGCVRITVRSPEENKQFISAIKEIL